MLVLVDITKDNEIVDKIVFNKIYINLFKF